MDDSAARMRTNMEKVLRAMDVIPPFRPEGTQDNREGGSTQQASSGPQAARRRATSQTPDGAASGDKAKREKGKITIPEFDLGEKILAEQRRMTARKRRAPGAPETKPVRRVERVAAPPRIPLAAPSSEELAQLEHIVADIVTRDIEHLCTGPTKVLN